MSSVHSVSTLVVNESCVFYSVICGFAICIFGYRPCIQELTERLIRKVSSKLEAGFMMLKDKRSILLKAAGLLALALSSVGLIAETSSASRYDNQIQTAVTHKLADKRQFNNVKANVQDGIVTLSGTVELYQHKADAAKLARKAGHVQGVRNLLDVAGPTVSDVDLAQKLAKKLRYVRE